MAPLAPHHPHRPCAVPQENLLSWGGHLAVPGTSLLYVLGARGSFRWSKSERTSCLTSGRLSAQLAAQRLSKQSYIIIAVPVLLPGGDHGQELSWPRTLLPQRRRTHSWPTPGTKLLPTLLSCKDLPDHKKGTELIDKHTHMDALVLRTSKDLQKTTTWHQGLPSRDTQPSTRHVSPRKCLFRQITLLNKDNV